MIGGLCFLGMGLILVGIWDILRRRAKRTLTWPQVTGKVLEAKVVFSSNGEGESQMPHILYSYEVNGTPHKSCAVGASGMMTAADIVQKYPVGRTVQVFYDPVRPESAVLERNGSALILILVLAIASVLAAVAFLSGSGA
jgi:hypothetical protein